MEKDFNKWNNIKQELDNFTERLPSFREREIWWCSIGVNIGFEIYGKGNIYTRPVLVLAKYSKFTFLGLPLTSSYNKQNPYHFPINLDGKSGSVLLSQGRMLDSKRLAGKISKISENNFERIKKAFKDAI